jgi:hypothetical protein
MALFWIRLGNCTLTRGVSQTETVTEITEVMALFWISLGYGTLTRRVSHTDGDKDDRGYGIILD